MEHDLENGICPDCGKVALDEKEELCPSCYANSIEDRNEEMCEVLQDQEQRYGESREETE